MKIVAITLTFFILKTRGAKSSLRAVGGRDAEPEEFPYVVRLEYRKLHDSEVLEPWGFCTGSVIAPTWTLTAAHCLDDYLEIVNDTTLKFKYFVRYGSVRAPPESKTAFSNINAGFTYPTYKGSRQTKYSALKVEAHFLRNDIGLFKTDPIEIPEYGQLSAAPYKSLIGLEVVAAGYGMTNTSSGERETTLQLKKPLQIINVLIKTCAIPIISLYPGLCLSPPCSNVNYLLSGDSGGPAIHGSGVVGVMSTSLSKIVPRRLDDSYVPRESAQFTAVSPYLNWIFSYINK